MNLRKSEGPLLHQVPSPRVPHNGAGGAGVVHRDRVPAAATRAAHGGLDARGALTLQRTAGNRAVAGLVQPQGTPAIQRITVGKDEVKNITELAPLMGLTPGQVLARFTTALGNFPAPTEALLNAFLNGRQTRVRASVSNTDAFMTKLANVYKDTYMERHGADFAQNLKTIKQNPDYRRLVDPHGINYAEGVDDGASIKDTYDVALACSLFALLRLKPGFLGATTPKDLHQIFRSNPKTKNYDNDREVAQIRVAAGLQFQVPALNTVSSFTGALTEADRNRKFIIDPTGAAHTFALVWAGGRWTKFDNDNQGGVAPANDGIRVVWE